MRERPSSPFENPPFGAGEADAEPVAVAIVVRRRGVGRAQCFLDRELFVASLRSRRPQGDRIVERGEGVVFAAKTNVHRRLLIA